MTADAALQRLVSFLKERDAVMDTYLRVLDQQHRDIEQSDMETLQAHTELESELFDRLQSLQRVIEPLAAQRPEAGGEAAELEERFAGKRDTALEKSRLNQRVLRRELDRLTQRMEGLKRTSARTGASYGGSARRRSDGPRHVDLQQ